ncbi:MAG: hypothetical protein A3A65_03185 [Candidatus Chisholmbacteria bacterium RIFCSPLOWO2_01_FULL_49_14]|uniref:UDP-N-acetylmuramoyl-L-alanyl-D-glutamate--2, 6-diaminopimelate ligase n=1 Tax=Candidatus Chisholmbacteria bacterium RIFCSPLOWO2_01_FULL_49_14 TaxID=1797593 RepID=A0A1G1W318_9BACT|nr:MAG: hypothetical protein A3A65_03185 [Candidatus Chisholmbacteria bacterium RIFCSPLOWO2_01_FULL_49_14]
MSSKIWSVARNSRPLRAVLSIVPKRHINRFYHLPKAVVANLIYGFPSRKLTVIGVTGTKGKTSVCHILHHILTQSGKKTALISTIGAFIGDRQIDTGLHVTNPDPFTLQSLLKRALLSGCGYVVLEVTSHGLEQYRNWGIDFSVAVYTQIKSDHLDYHGGKKQYRLAKAKLLEQAKAVVLNRSDPSFSYLKKLADRRGIPVTSYTAQDDIESQNNEAALTAAVILGVRREDALRDVSSVPGVPGRMDVVMRHPFTLVIDFAHTPDSFKRALKKLRTMVKGRARLIAVFGCAGERDPDRRKMGAVAAKLCDIFVITAEDPRSESVAGISQEIADWAVKSGALEVSLSAVPERRAGQTMFIKIPDRQQAIDDAVNLARQGDVVGLFGKGHEKSMNEGGMEVPWSEHDALAQALTKKQGEKWATK